MKVSMIKASNNKQDDHMKKLIITILLTGSVMCSSAYGIEQTVTRMDNDLEKLKMGEDISIQSYSASFAKRMGLPKSIYGEPREPIKGYEYRMTRALDGTYKCDLNVYFDNAMDFKYPEGDVGAKYFIRHKLLSRQKMDNPDRRFKRIYKNKYNMKIFIASSDYVFRKQGFRGSYSLRFYRKHLLNGIGFMTIFVPNCDFGRAPKKHHLNIWLEKSNGKNYTKIGLIVDPNDFNKYQLPKEFQRKVHRLSEKARRKNSSIRKANKTKRQNLTNIIKGEK